MFRHVTEQCKQPHFMLVCDHPKCGQVVRMEVPPNEPMDRAQAAFVATAVQEGWGIGLDAQLCPAHFRAQEDARQTRNLVQVARSVPGVVDRKAAG